MATAKKSDKHIPIMKIIRGSGSKLQADLQFWTNLGLLLFVPSVIWALIIQIVIGSDAISETGVDLSEIDSNLWLFIIGEAILGVYQIILVSLFVPIYIKSAKGTKLKDPRAELEASKKTLKKVLLTGIATLAIVLFGLLFLIIPGLIAALLLAFSVYIAADTKLGVLASLERSANYFKLNVGFVLLSLLAIGLVFFGIQILLGIFNLLLGPVRVLLNEAVFTGIQLYTGIAAATIYLDIRKRYKPKA